MKEEFSLSYNYSIPKTLSQSIYNYLKTCIINNRIRANEKINEKEIAHLFQVSTTPVREAVLRLGAEGFVTIDSHREAVVREVSFIELNEIVQVLAALDSLAVSLIVDELNQDALKELEDLTREMERHTSRDSLDKYMALNFRIHRKMWQFLPHKFLRETLEYVSDQMLRYSYAYIHASKKPEVIKRSITEHREILEALKRKERKKLKNLVLNHWVSFLQPTPFAERIKEYLTKDNP